LSPNAIRPDPSATATITQTGRPSGSFRPVDASGVETWGALTPPPTVGLPPVGSEPGSDVPPVGLPAEDAGAVPELGALWWNGGTVKE
jgi:hypothetical protein